MRPNSCALTYAAVPKDATEIAPKYATEMSMQLHVKVYAAGRRGKKGELETWVLRLPNIAGLQTALNRTDFALPELHPCLQSGMIT